MRRFFCAIMALLLVALWVLPASASVPQHAGIAQVTGAVHESVGTDTPGAAVVLFENGTRILYEGYGYADISARTLVTAESRFEIGEISSLFVALAAHSLAQEQKLELDRDIAYYLPADFMKKLNLSRRITVNDLLAGDAGFADRYLDLRYQNPALVFDTLEQALLADVPAQSEPQGSLAYSRFGITLVAFVVECVSGTDYATYVDERILTPLGMKSTVLAPHVGEAQNTAAGHVAKGEGSFALAADAGRTYSALWPADGALSNASDLSLLIQYLMTSPTGLQILTPTFTSGVFQTGAVGFSADGAQRARSAGTPHFSASLCMDAVNARAALVLCNTESSALLDEAYEYCGFVSGVRGLNTESALPELSLFEGEYILRTKTVGTLYARAVKNVKVSADGAGGLLFGEQRLVQIAPGVFADPDAQEIAVVQFLMSVEGEIVGVLTVNGESYRPASFLERDAVLNVLFIALAAFAIYFLLGGVLALCDAILSRARGERRPRAWRFTLPWVLAGVNALIVLVQIRVCSSFGAGTIASFLTACGTVSLLFVIGAVCGFIYALFTGFTVRRMTARVARSAILYLVFLLLCGYWGLVLI